MDPCSGISGNITHYKMKFHSQPQSFVATERVNISRCAAGWCSHFFKPNFLNGNVPSSYDNVSVAAGNVVGTGLTRNCTAQAISELQINSVGNGCFNLSLPCMRSHWNCFKLTSFCCWAHISIYLQKQCLCIHKLQWVWKSYVSTPESCPVTDCIPFASHSLTSDRHRTLLLPRVGRLFM